jgi:pimeloyl-ACP methyl ester carboxylesterase
MSKPGDFFNGCTPPASGSRIEKVAALQAVMRAIHQPTLIIWGRRDRLVPPDYARILEAKLPRSTTVLFDECGHLPQLEQPRQFTPLFSIF